MTDHGVPVFQRWCCSAAAALLLHGGAAGLLMARAASAVPAPVPKPALVWVGVGEPSVLTAQSAGSREAEKHGKDEGAAARSFPTHSAPRAPSPTRSTASAAPAGSAAAAMRSAQPVATAALSPRRSTPSPSGSSASESLDARANESGSTDGAGAAAAQGSGAPRDRAAGASAARGHGLDAAPRLLDRDSPCADLFPYAARSDRGSVEVAIDVAASGRPLAAQIVDEAPRGQGFALAARHCVRRLRFSPALDASGKAVASRSVVQMRFERQRETARASL